MPLIFIKSIPRQTYRAPSIKEELQQHAVVLRVPKYCEIYVFLPPKRAKQCCDATNFDCTNFGDYQQGQ